MDDYELFKTNGMTRPLTIIRSYLLRHQESIAVAESVTAGNIQAALSIGAHALNFFAGGITTYNIEQKVKHLKVSRSHAERVNCVSRKVAVEMARGAAKLFSSDWAIGITGYSGPVPEEGIHSLFAWIAIVYQNRPVLTKRITLRKMTPLMAQRTYSKKALALFTSCIIK